MAQNRVQEKYSCIGRTQDACRKEYLSKHRELKYVRVPSDGNCFFRAIAAYYRRTGDRIDRVSAAGVNPIRYHQLRRYIVNELGKQLREDPVMKNTLQGMYNDPKKPHRYNKMKINGEISIEKILSTLARTCKWNLPAFEMMVERVPIILNINLILYKIVGNSSQYYVTKSIHTPYDGAPVATTISIFLESNHYGLIFPAEDAQNAMKESFDEGENDSDDENDDDNNDDDNDDDDEEDATAALIAEMLEQNEQNERNAQKAKKASRKKGKAPAQNSRKASHHNSNSNNGIAELESQIVEVRKRRAAKARANAALAQSFSAISFNSRNNRNKLEQQNALNGSRRVSAKKKPPVEDLCKGMTIQVIRQYLLSMGVGEDAMPPKMLKRDLCALYLSFIE